MKKLIKFYKNNRIYCILMIISLICLLVIIASLILYFTSQISNSKYGHRLDDIAEHPVENEINDLKGYFESNDKVQSVSIDTKGKIIYVNLTVKAELANNDIQSICTESLAKLTDEQKTYYDIQYIVKRDGLNPYLGSKSVSKKMIAWANFNYEEEKELTDDEIGGDSDED